MSKYLPPAIIQSDLEEAQSPVLGGEAVVSVSPGAWLLLADIKQPLADSGVMTLNQAYVIPSGGVDLVMLVDHVAAQSVAEIVATFAVTFSDNTTGSATATFAVPAREANQSFSVPIGMAVDITGTAGNSPKQVKAIGGLTSFVGGAPGNRYKIISLPDINSFVQIGTTNEANFVLDVGKSVAIPSGMFASRFVKRGRGDAGMLTVVEKYVDYLDGITRLNGSFCTAMVEIQKAERIVSDRFVVSRWYPASAPKFGDGSDISLATAEGIFAYCAIFSAP